MSNKLKEARKIINEVDSQMAELVCEHKMEFGLPMHRDIRKTPIIKTNGAIL